MGRSDNCGGSEVHVRRKEERPGVKGPVFAEVERLAILCSWLSCLEVVFQKIRPFAVDEHPKL